MGVQNEGMYRLTVKSGQCWGYSEKEVRINCATRVASEEGVEDQLQVKVWENPTRGKLQVEVTLADPEAIELYWSDGQGKQLESWSVKEAKQQHRLELDVLPYQEGMYLLQIQSTTKQKTVKVWRMD
ncbi:MAG: T9SS type A sorting domain-containing protein [Spirosomataceae bacterium]